MFFIRLLYCLVSVIIFIVEYLEHLFGLYFIKHHGVAFTHTLNDKKILADTGYVDLGAVHKKKMMVEYEIETSLCRKFRCADNHIVYCERTGGEIYAKDLRKGDMVITIAGYEKVVGIKRRILPTIMYDVTTDDANHRYISDGILSHNSITVAIYIVWYILTNVDKNIVLLSQNQDKVTDLMEKIRTIIQNLPFYLKPGITVDNVMSMQFDNKVNLSAKTTTENSAAGITGHLIYIDEFALINPNFLKSFFRTVYPALSSSKIAQMIITSTPRGTNKFYDIYQGAMDGKNSFDPLRTDWYEVPDKILPDGTVIYRDDNWKNKQIADLGSEEDFNQEFGNQFLAGSQLLFGSAELKKLKFNEIEFVEYEMPELDDAECSYRGFLRWHPMFDMDELKTGKFIFSIDLAGGTGGDFSVINIYQVLAMNRREIENLKIYTEEKDFFKLVQVGLWRANTIDTPDVAKVCYHLLVDVFDQDNCKVILENNYDGKGFIRTVTEIYGDDENMLDIDSVFVQFLIGNHSSTMRIGLTLDQDKRDYGCRKIKDKVKNNQLVIVEVTSVNEAISFYRNKKGKFIGQGHDDIMLTNVNVCHIFDTDDFAEMVDDLMQEMPQKFHELMADRLNRAVVRNQYSDDDDYADLIG